MNGVEILSSETIYNTILPEYWLGIGLGLGFIFVILMAGCFANDQIILGLACIALALGSGAVGSLGATYSKTNISHIEYKVAIDDSVSMNEFLDKYEILDQEGKIYTVKERVITDTEFIAKLTEERNYSDFSAWIEWNWNHPQWRELSNESQFRDWFNSVFDSNGLSETDEHYAYLGKTKIDKELGSRLSWFNTWECFGTVEHLELSDEDDSFPLYAHAFSYDKEKYWVLTMVGQGAISWLMTDEAFKKEYMTKEKTND